MEWNSAKKKIERNQLLPRTIWINLKQILLSQRSQMQTTHTVRSHLYEILVKISDWLGPGKLEGLTAESQKRLMR